jgi:RNA polymerase sigma factor (sigma-70 family)
MPRQPLHEALDHVRRLCLPQTPAAPPDQDLLRRFAAARDEAAFAQLVQRHGPMVLGVCRRVLNDPHAAEDAFQATFLALARRPAGIRKHASVGGWLHRVAYRAAQRERFAAARRQARERQAPVAAGPERDPLAELSWREVSVVLDAELQALPDRFRAPLVLCYLEGMTRDEAARHLGWSAGAVKGRLERGRELLRRRLVRRGVTLSAALLGSQLAQAPAAALPALFAARVARLALPFSLGQAAGLPGPAAALAEGVLRALALARFKAAALALLLASLTSLAFAWWCGRGAPAGGAGQTDEPTARVAAPAQAQGPERPAVDLHGDPLPPGAIARLGTVRFRGAFLTPCFLPDGKMLLTASRASLQLWEAATGRLRREIPTGSLTVFRVALSPDGTRVAATGMLRATGALRVWDVGTGTEVRTFSEPGRTADQNAVAFTPDGKLLVTTGAGTLRFEEIATGKEVRRRVFGVDTNPAFALSPDGATVAIAPGANTRKFYLWDWKTDQEPRAIMVKGRPPSALRFSPDSSLLASCDDTGSVLELWEARTGKVACTIDLTAERVIPLDLAFSPDGKLLAITDGGNRKEFSGGLYLWDLQAGRLAHKLLTPGEQGLFTGFSRDGRRVAMTTTGAVHVWDLPAARLTADVQAAHRGEITAVAVSSQGLVATASFDHTVRVWDAASGRQTAKLDHGATVRALALSPDGRTLAAACFDNSVRLWDLRNGTETKRLGGHGRIGWQQAVVFTPDGQRLLGWGDELALRTWEVRTGKLLAERPLPAALSSKAKTARERAIAREQLFMLGVGPGCFSPSGKHFVLALNQTFEVYDTATGKHCQSIPRPGWRVTGLAFAADGRSFVASLGARGQEQKRTVGLFEFASGKLRRSFVLPGRQPGPVALSADGQLVAAGVDLPAGEIRVFSLATGRVVATLAGGGAKAANLAFSPDGRLLVSGMSDTSALVWRLPPLSQVGR